MREEEKNANQDSIFQTIITYSLKGLAFGLAFGWTAFKSFKIGLLHGLGFAILIGGIQAIIQWKNQKKEK